MDDGIYVYLLDFGDCKVNETVTANADGTYSIFLNARISYKAQQEAYQHALNHIKRNDFEKFNVDQIEYECHNMV